MYLEVVSQTTSCVYCIQLLLTAFENSELNLHLVYQQTGSFEYHSLVQLKKSTHSLFANLYLNIKQSKTHFYVLHCIFYNQNRFNERAVSTF